MSDYTRITNFTAKDILATGNPSKKVLGSEIDAEYNAARTAINSKQDDLITTRGDILRGSSSNIAERLALSATSGHVLKSDGTDISWGVPFGIVAVSSTIDGALNSGNTMMINDSSIPQNTEGNLFLSVTHTPAHASNSLIVFVTGNFATSVSGSQPIVMALFSDQSGSADALSAVVEHDGAPDNQLQLTLSHILTAGTTSATTFTMRAGLSAAGTIYFNGTSGGVKMGGKMGSSIIVVEIRSAG